MPAGTEPNKTHARRAQRQPKSVAQAKPTQATPAENTFAEAMCTQLAQAPAESIESDVLKSSPPNKPPKKKRERRTKPNDIQVSGQQPPELPLTPPRSLNHKERNAPGSQNIPSVQHTPSNKTSSSQADVSLLSTPTHTRSPRSPHQYPQFNTMTPAKLNKPPTQAYAGPTFQASPAPSSLPIPKFFSRSLPLAEKGTGAIAMMKTEDSESSSNKSDDSPVMMNAALRLSENRAREASPLDLFFRADREEKARRQLESPRERPVSDGNRSKSASPMPEVPHRHSTQPTEGSNTGFLPLELDASERSISKAESPKAGTLRREGERAESSPPVIMTQASHEAQARAKTQALKNLLLSPRPQRPNSAAAQGGSTSEFDSSPTSSPSPRPSLNPRHKSGSSTPAYGAGTSPSYPFYQPSPSTSGKRSFNSRSQSSLLRQEMINDVAAASNELPSTPTPSRFLNVYKTPSPPDISSVQTNGSHSTFTPAPTKFQPEDALKASLGRGHGSSSERGSEREQTPLDEIENELRRVLKLDVVGGGADGVRS